MLQLKRFMAIFILIVFATGMIPAAVAGAESAEHVSSIEELRQAIESPSTGNEIELVLDNGNYTIPAGGSIRIPEGKTVTVYADSGVYIHHQPAENSSVFEVPANAVLYLIGTGSEQTVIENATLDEINAAIAAAQQGSAGTESAATSAGYSDGNGGAGSDGISSAEGGDEIGMEYVVECTEYVEGLAGSDVPFDQIADTAAEGNSFAALSNGFGVRGITVQGDLHITNVCFKGFNAENEWDPVRGYAVYNEGRTWLKDVTVLNASGEDAEDSIYSSAALAIEAGDSLTKDSYVKSSGEFYSKAQRAADEAPQVQTQQEQQDAEPEGQSGEQTGEQQGQPEAQQTQDVPYVEIEGMDPDGSFTGEQTVQEQPAEGQLTQEPVSEELSTELYAEQQALNDIITEAWGYAASADKQKENAELYHADASVLYSVPGASCEDLAEDMDAAGAAYEVANLFATNAETLLSQHPDSQDLMQAATYARNAANLAMEHRDAINEMYADLCEEAAELPAGTYLVSPQMYSDENTSGQGGIVLQGSGVTETQTVEGTGSDWNDSAEVTVSATPAPTTAPTPTPYVTTSTQDTSAKQTITVYASWNDSNNAYSRRPASVLVTIKMNGATYMNAYISAEDGWAKTFTVPAGASYNVVEDTVSGYTTSYSVSGSSGGSIVTLNHTYSGPTNSTATTGTYSGGTTGSYSGTQTTTYNGNQAAASTGTQSTASTGTQTTTYTGTQTANYTGAQTAAGTQTYSASVTPGPSSTPSVTPTPVPAFTTAPTQIPATPVQTAAATDSTQSGSRSRAWIWILLLLLSAAAIVAVLLYLNHIKKVHEAEVRARARARRKAQAQAETMRRNAQTGDVNFDMGTGSLDGRSSGAAPQRQNRESGMQAEIADSVRRAKAEELRRGTAAEQTYRNSVSGQTYRGAGASAAPRADQYTQRRSDSHAQPQPDAYSQYRAAQESRRRQDSDIQRSSRNHSYENASNLSGKRSGRYSDGEY